MLPIWNASPFLCQNQTFQEMCKESVHFAHNNTVYTFSCLFFAARRCSMSCCADIQLQGDGCYAPWWGAPVVRVGGHHSYARQRLCFAAEGVIFIRCNSVGSPTVCREKCFTSFRTRTSIILSRGRKGRQVYQVGGSRLSLCFPLNSWSWRWLMDSCVPQLFPPLLVGIVYFLQVETRRND